MKLLFYVFVVLVLFTGCSHRFTQRSRKLPHHPFEKNLYVVGSTVPFLSQKEWSEIQAQYSKRRECVFESGERETDDLVRVWLAYKDDASKRRGVTLYFEKRENRWIENEGRAEEILILGP
jgi:hypothetical protein